MKFGYWNIRGRANPAKLILAYAEAEYESVDYVIGEEEWQKDKKSLGLDFPNLPYLIDGDVKLTESWAIIRYLGKKFNLRPTADSEERACDMLEGVLSDAQRILATAAYSPDFVEKLAQTRESQAAKLKNMDQFLSERHYTAGSKLTYVDFVLYDIVDWHRLLFPDVLDDMKNLQGFMKRIESLKPIAAHLSSKNYKKFPIFAPFAIWGGKDHDDRTW